jgi:hypothetical protein
MTTAPKRKRLPPSAHLLVDPECRVRDVICDTGESGGTTPRRLICCPWSGTIAKPRTLDLLCWGLVPHWAKDLNIGFANINAKAEGIESKPAFLEAFQRRRCLVPATAFTSGRRPRKASSPMRSHLPIGASRLWPTCGRTGVRPRASGCAASRSSRLAQRSCARSYTTGCQWFWGGRHGRPGSGRSRQTFASSKRFLRHIPQRG